MVEMYQARRFYDLHCHHLLLDTNGIDGKGRLSNLGARAMVFPIESSPSGAQSASPRDVVMCYQGKSCFDV